MEAFAILVLINIHVYMLTWYRKLAKSGFAKVLINFGGFGEPSMNKHTYSLDIGRSQTQVSTRLSKMPQNIDRN